MSQFGHSEASNHSSKSEYTLLEPVGELVRGRTGSNRSQKQSAENRSFVSSAQHEENAGYVLVDTESGPESGIGWRIGEG